MPYSSTFGASRGAKRTGRWFVLVFLCMVLILAVVPAASLGHSTSKCFVWQKVVLRSSRSCVTAGSSVKLTACAVACPSKATISLQSLVSGTWTTVATGTPKCGTVTFVVTPTCKTSYRAVLTSSSGTVTSNKVCVCVAPKVTLCIKNGTYGGTIVISGTVTPAETGNVTITIDKVGRWCHTQRVATLTVALVPGTGSSSFATNWTGTGGTCYVITVKVPKTASLEGACASKQIKL